LVGLTADLAENGAAGRPGESGPLFHRHELRHAYAEAILACGGLPVVLPTSTVPADELVERLEALVLTGGAFDIPPSDYGEAPAPGLGPLKPDRTAFERGCFLAAERRGLPILGICGGMQLIAVARGGALYQHLPAELPGLAHEQPNDRREPGHRVRLREGSLLAHATGTTELWVNSSHHQGVKRLGARLVACGSSDDGLVEAIEDPSRPFLVGVQWHPELRCGTTPPERRLFERFIEAAREGRR
ncbi:MAG: gamma-glutamyl-gamma-aminobutyrate hydrolase family protein, partial [Deltaproteobacteria bacterium]